MKVFIVIVLFFLSIYLFNAYTTPTPDPNIYIHNLSGHNSQCEFRDKDQKIIWQGEVLPSGSLQAPFSESLTVSGLSIWIHNSHGTSRKNISDLWGQAKSGELHIHISERITVESSLYNKPTFNWKLL